MAVSTMGTKFRVFVLFALSSATVSIQSKRETAALLHSFSERKANLTEDGLSTAVSSNDSSTVSSYVNINDSSTVSSYVNSNDSSTVSSYVNSNDSNIMDYLSEEKGSIDTDKNTFRDANFGPIIDIFVDVGIAKTAATENLEKSPTNGNQRESLRRALMSENLETSDSNENSHEPSITKGMLVDFFTKLEGEVGGKNSDGSDLTDKVNPGIVLGSKTHTSRSKDSDNSNPGSKDTNDTFSTRLEAPQNIEDVSESTVEMAKGANINQREISIERFPIFAPIPYLANIPFFIPIPRPVDNMTSRLEILPPSTYVSDRLPVPDVELMDEKSALIVAEDNDSDNHGSEAAKEVISQILGSLFGVKLPPPPPIPYLPILSENKEKVQFQNESKVVDMFGRKYLMRSKMSQLPFDDKSGVILKFMSLTPLETRNEGEEKDESKVKTTTREEISKEIEKESILNDQQEAKADEKANGPDSGNEIFRTMQDPYKKSLLNTKPDILIVGQSPGFETEGSAESTRREIDEANLKNLEGFNKKSKTSEVSSQKKDDNAEPGKFDMLKREGSYSAEIGKEGALKHESSDDMNKKIYDNSAVGDTDSPKVDKSNDPLLTSGLVKPKDSIVIKNTDEFRSTVKDKFSVASKKEGIFEKNSEDKENPRKKPKEIVAKPSTVSLEDGIYILKEAVETPYFEIDEKLKSEDKDLKSEDQDLKFEIKDLKSEDKILKSEKKNLKSEKKDLKSEDKELKFEYKQLKSEDRDLTLEGKDGNSEGLFLTSENEDLAFKDKDLKSGDEKFTFKSKTVTSEKKDLTAEIKTIF